MALEDKNPIATTGPEADVVAAIRARLDDGRLSCVDAFAVTEECMCSPVVVGQTMDQLGHRLSRCQLGLFGYPNKQGWEASGVTDLDVPNGLEEAITTLARPRAGLLCSDAWNLARTFRIPRMQVGWVTEKLGIKIIACQLGAF